jgi:2'-hydroxyisoflavone reductase
MRLLVLGGSSFVGRAVVEDGLRRGFSVTTFNRGNRPAVDVAVESLIGDRLIPGDLRVLRGREWDVVVDTWSGAPRAAAESATMLADRAGVYAYVSSGSVYAPPPPIGGDESSPTVDAAPDAADGEYAELKRGAELAIGRAFGDRALFARAGLILGPHEDVGRLPWWLLRMHRGGEVLAPGPPELPIQYIDARDLAAWMLDAAAQGLGGAYNVVRRAGEETMGSLLEACRETAGADGTTLTWVAPDAVLASGVEPWTELPVWIPPEHEYRGLHAADVERVHAAGLRPRPLRETVADTWMWLESLDLLPPQRADRDQPGLDAGKEAAVLAAAAAR